MSVVTLDVADGVATITLADTDNRNALGPVLIEELLSAIDTADADDAMALQPASGVIGIAHRYPVAELGAAGNRIPQQRSQTASRD